MLKAYTELFRLKPIGLIVSMVLFAHLFALHETGLSFQLVPVIILLGTTGLANAASFALNQYYEREADSKMTRTMSRPIPSGRIRPQNALIAGLTVLVVALVMQYLLINTATAFATFLCGALYVWTYTPLKSRSNLSTLIGSLPGAILPFIGWFSVTQGFDLMIIWMSLMIFLWQIPHTFAICFRYKDEFQAAGGKQLPFVVGEKGALRQSLWYTIINIPLIFVPILFRVSGGVYLLVAAVFTTTAIVLAARFYVKHEARSARVFFVSMLTYLPVLFVSMAADRLVR